MPSPNQPTPASASVSNNPNRNLQPPIRTVLSDRKVQVKHKSSSWLMRLLAVVLGWVGIDFKRFWTTVNGSTIYAPDHVDLNDLEPHRVTIQHELVHIAQARRYWLFWQLSYVLLLPVGLAWGRWASEREAYMVNLKAGTMTISEVVDTLWKNYIWTWPKPWMRKWLQRELLKWVRRRHEEHLKLVQEMLAARHTAPAKPINDTPGR